MRENRPPIDPRRERRERRRREVRRRRAVAIGAVLLLALLVGSVLGVVAAAGGDADETQAKAPALAVSTPAGSQPQSAREPLPDGSLGDPATRSACALLTRPEIRARFGGPVGRPAAMWPFCRWDVDGDSFLALWAQPRTPVGDARRRLYVERDAPGVGAGAFYANDRSLTFGDGTGSFRLLFQAADEFTGTRTEGLEALARTVLARSRSVAPASPRPTPRPVDVYFAGDSLAAGPIWAYLERNEGRRLLSARGEYHVGTGLLRGDFFDWVRHLRGIAGARTPGVVVVMAGANDGQDAIVDGRYYPVGSATWKRVLRSRVAGALAAAASAGARVVWVGMPPMRDATLNRGMAAVNAVARREVSHRGAIWVDAWTLFSAPGGSYTDTDRRGTNVRLEDGIHLNVAGSIALARAVTRAVDQARRTQDQPAGSG